MRVAVADIHEKSVVRNVKEITDSGDEDFALVWDLSKLESMPGQLERIRKRFGHVDILVNNSSGPPPTSASGVAPEKWQLQFHDMVLSLIHLTDLILPSMSAKGGGRIITSTSSGAVAPIPNLAISNALRSALVGWSKTLSTEVAAEGITVNVILPGRIDTQRIGRLDEARAKREGKSKAEVIKQSIKKYPAAVTASHKNTARQLPSWSMNVPPTSPARSFVSMAAISAASDLCVNTFNKYGKKYDHIHRRTTRRYPPTLPKSRHI